MSRLSKLETRVSSLEKTPGKPSASPSGKDSAAKSNGKAAGDEDDDDIDLFGSDEEDEEAAKVREKRLADYAAKKSKSRFMEYHFLFLRVTVLTDSITPLRKGMFSMSRVYLDIEDIDDLRSVRHSSALSYLPVSSPSFPYRTWSNCKVECFA